VPEELKSEFAFKAGQYIILKTTIQGKDIRRDYSLCTNPESKELSVVVKAVPHGAFSSYANTVLKSGDSLEVSPPKGKFIFEPNMDQNRTIVAFAAGSGITPIMSIARTVLEQEPQSNFILVYGNKTPEDVIFYNDIISLQKYYGNRFNLKLIFSRSNENDALFGRIGRSTVNYTLNNCQDSQNIDAFYLCGPEEMINNVKEALIERGVSKDKIKFELFFASIKDSKVKTEDIGDGKTKITVIVDDEEATFTMPQKKTILEVALENDIDAPFSCKGGICCSCVARIKEGKVMMRQNNILTDSELEEGLILTCQSQPTTSTVIIDYDDV
jgi:ring-1,2-phenylacetyl-CoA epoxidase subunit PaaE